MSLPPVLLLGVDTPIGLAVIRELGSRGVPVQGVGRTRDAIGRGSRWLDGFSLRPEGALASWLPALIDRTGAEAVMAVSEGDLVALAALPSMIGGCRILTPRTGPLAVVLDKPRTLAAAARLAIDVPESWQPLSADDPIPPGLGWPVVVKWSDPNAIGPRLAEAGLELVKTEYARDAAALRALLTRYAKVFQSCDDSARGDPALPLVQAYARGVGFGQMLHMAEGRATLRFQHERLHEWPPEGGVSTLCRAVPLTEHAAQMAKSEALLAAIGWDGPAMVEYRFDPATGRYVLMEVNGRFWGSQPLATACGAEFAWEQYRRAMLGETAPAPAWRAGLRARYMVPETKRLVRLLARRPAPDPAFRPSPWRDLALWLAGFLDPRMRYYVWRWRDPGPLLVDLTGMVRRVARRRNRAPAPAPRARSGAGWWSYRPR